MLNKVGIMPNIGAQQVQRIAFSSNESPAEEEFVTRFDERLNQGSLSNLNDIERLSIHNAIFATAKELKKGGYTHLGTEALAKAANDKCDEIEKKLF